MKWYIFVWDDGEGACTPHVLPASTEEQAWAAWWALGGTTEELTTVYACDSEPRRINPK